MLEISQLVTGSAKLGRQVLGIGLGLCRPKGGGDVQGFGHAAKHEKRLPRRFPMSRRDWLLLYIALKGSPAGIDPVKIQKGKFLMAMEGGLPDNENYAFRPYLYGPMSSPIYSDVERLEAEGLIEGDVVPGYTWKRYKATAAGIDVARNLLEDADPNGARKLFEIKRHVAAQRFPDLLRDVYAQYPQYATRSVFSG